MTTKMKIINGPSKWDLSLAIFQPNYEVEFTIEDEDGNPQQVAVVVTGVELKGYPDDRSFFDIKGYSDSDTLTQGQGARAYFKATFSLTQRVGQLRITNV